MKTWRERVSTSISEQSVYVQPSIPTQGFAGTTAQVVDVVRYLTGNVDPAEEEGREPTEEEIDRWLESLVDDGGEA